MKPFRQKFRCDVIDRDRAIVEMTDSEDPWVVLETHIYSGNQIHRILLTPKRARKMAKALRKGAKQAAKNA